jgi:hypothetical protein
MEAAEHSRVLLMKRQELQHSARLLATRKSPVADAAPLEVRRAAARQLLMHDQAAEKMRSHWRSGREQAKLTEHMRGAKKSGGGW